VAFAVTAIDRPAAPATGAAYEAGASVTLPVTPPCVTVNVCPPIVNRPVRLATFVPFAATLYVTVPFPVPVAPPVTVNHPASDTAVHPKSVAFAVTPTVPPVRPAEPTASLAVDNVTLPVNPLCVTVCVLPPIVSVPVRPTTLASGAHS